MKNWILAVRPKTLFASIAPVILGLFLSLHSHSKLYLPEAFLTIICALFLQIASNIANDYLDSLKGIDTEKRLGPTRVTQSGMISVDAMKRALIFCLVISFGLGIYLMIKGGIPIIIIGLLSIYFAYGYTGGPFPLSQNGLGEIAAFIFFGIFAVGGTYFLQTKTYSSLVFTLSLGPGFISATILAINNLRDISTDNEARKRTIAVIFGERFQRNLCIILILFSWITLLLSSIIFSIKSLFIVSFLPLFFIRNWISIYKKPISKEMNNYLAKTAQYLLLYCLLTGLALLYQWG